jgi:DNA-binding transcriptional LysR family regulator
LVAIFARAGFGPPVMMEGGLPSTRTVLGMVAAGLTIALIDPVMAQMATRGVVCRPLEGPGVFIESGVIYRRSDPSALLTSFLYEMEIMSRSVDAPAAARRKPAARKATRRS